MKLTQKYEPKETINQTYSVIPMAMMKKVYCIIQDAHAKEDNPDWSSMAQKLYQELNEQELLYLLTLFVMNKGQAMQEAWKK